MRGYDKWEAYLPLYEQIMQQVKPGSAYLEIGVQNMGWLAALDPQGLFTRCVACDIDPAVAAHAAGTRFTDIVIGDSATEATFRNVSALNVNFDLIVDDASHTRQNILANFMLYWPLLRDGGHFMIEDCHTDFSPDFAENNYFGTSIYEFFSSLTELPTLSNFDAALRCNNLSYRIMRRFHSKEYSDAIADSIKNITFSNSCILITKGDPSIGEHILSGDEWPVVPRTQLNSFFLPALGRIVKSLPELAVVYLNRGITQAEIEARVRFVEAYQRYRPAVPHQLYVVNKGFTAEQQSQQYMLFKDLEPRFINLDDEGLDLTAYSKAALQIEERIVFFMNTHSEPLHPGWLDKVYAAFTSSSQIGLVGCTGSGGPFAPGYSHYSNYHIRTNGFMIAREDYLDMVKGRPLKTKLQAHQFEAGKQSMTWMIHASGRKALVVGKQGIVDTRTLWRAAIFRSGNQSNLLLADNQTRAYQVAPLLDKLRAWTASHSRPFQLHPEQLRRQLRDKPFSSVVKRSLALFRRDNKQGRPQNFDIRKETPGCSRLAVVVPTHLEQLDEQFAATLLHNATQLRDYKLEIVLPETNSPSWYESFFAKHGINGTVRLMPAKYFGSPAAVNKMGTDPAFYRVYQEFDYILICHLDAWIFRDQLAYWMEQGYDFIGAPLFLPENGNVHFLRRMAPFGGNGGLSLRRVASCIRVLETFHPGINPWRVAQAIWFLARNRRWGLIIVLFRLLRELSQDWRGTFNKYNIYEDVFFTIIAPLCGNRISIPPSRIAMQFSCEVEYPMLQKEVLCLEPPMGVHGYDKYIQTDYLDYIRGFFARKQQYYDGEAHTDAPVVSVVMIVKNLISSRRLETFDQALTSVINQTYHRLEVIILDGGSTDETLEVLQGRYGDVDKIVFHCKEDNSIWEGMFNGVDLAKGDLIAFMNSDDYFCTLDALELMVHRIVDEDADMVYGRALVLTGSEIELFPTHLHSVLNCMGIVHQATLIKKSVLTTVQPFTSGHITSENYLFVATLMAGFKILEVPETLVHYRAGGMSAELYGGQNFAQTVADYVEYMKKLTTVGRYLNDHEINLLLGFRGMYELGPIRFIRMILKIRDRRLRRLLLSSTWNALRRYGLKRLAKGKLLHWRKRLLFRGHNALRGKI
ncbi:DUF5672 family protein [Phyllobacterium leguminum]|uniref:Glycosyltransferase involved in cell wall biosynthesis n=1 Tax=Phyllobacterium leguminum TaxID=314237 RepID=A0A318TA89_9HYPH|nr:DUF5672 family protein [Phyllobacterium leguminum]PYE85238.1 glycosyltransferase involved in cell wall biosynthesis [Phyllobacterium leguminum]